jgi:hypothetical protein
MKINKILCAEIGTHCYLLPRKRPGACKEMLKEKEAPLVLDHLK